MASVASHHAEWMSLVDVSGPFLSIPVLKQALPNGLDPHEPAVAAELRAALDQLVEIDIGADRAELHNAFVRFVFHEVLGFENDVLRWDETARSEYRVAPTERAAELVPDAVATDDGPLLLLVSVLPPATGLGEQTTDSGNLSSPLDRMVEMLKANDCRVGVVTNGEQWTLVSQQDGENPGFASWWASLWREEQITLQAFRTLLGQDRFVSFPDDEMLGGLLDRSAEDQREVTTKLGNQTLDAVEILIRRIDQIDRDSGGQLLADVSEADLYDAAVTVMMRLIFLFFAEENDLLPTAEPLYTQRYAASTLRSQLQAQADEAGEEVLETRYDGWPRLLATWRGVYAGIEHSDLVLAPYGGSLFDPDRYPFLEGRQPGTIWSQTEAESLAIDNRTVLHLLTSLQTLDEKGHRRKLSFRALDVEQIGHVYEGMLDHTAARSQGWVLGLSGSGGKEPEIELDDLDAFGDEDALFKFLKEQTGRTPAAARKWMSGEESAKAQAKFGPLWISSFGGDSEVAERASRFAKFIRKNSSDSPTVFQPGSVYVADSSHRGATGAHYTPRVLTEEMVKHTLDPLVYPETIDEESGSGPSIISPGEILDLKICDPACGSGAFLVQACRYLSEALVESRVVHGELFRDPTPDDSTRARREVVERCLHGVDLNPMACEMAKLSLWLVTLAKDQPFSFLDHAIRCGDSLLGIGSIDQIINFHVDPKQGRKLHGGSLFDIRDRVEERVEAAAALVAQIEDMPTQSIADIEAKAVLDTRARRELTALGSIADRVIGTHLVSKNSREYDSNISSVASLIKNELDAGSLTARRPTTYADMFHWPLEFPQVFISGEHSGFDAFVANPPFLGGKRISGVYGTPYRRYLVDVLAKGHRGSADLVGYFFVRAATLTGQCGSLGLIATNTIAQGDTREIGLDSLVTDGWTIRRAAKSDPWPGVANLEISKVWLNRCEQSTHILDNNEVSGITSALNERTCVAGQPFGLSRSAGQSFIGSYILGSGFMMEPGEAEMLLEQEARNKDVLFLYLNGKDLNSRVDQSASRWVVNFFDWSSEQASEFSDCFELIARLVKPVRQKLNPDGSFKLRKPLPEKWWIYADKRPLLYRTIEGAERVLVLTRVSSTVMPAWVDNGQVYSDATVVFAYEDDARFGLLSSGFHWWWAVTHASTMRTDIRYTPSDCFETFAQPELDDHVAAAGKVLDETRREFMIGRNLGLTKTYNLVHDPEVVDADVHQLRDLHLELDLAVRHAYGWDDLDLDHGFHQTDQGMRFTFGPQARVEVLDRLLELNFERYIAEVEEGLHGSIPVPRIVTDVDGVVRMEQG